MTPPPFPPDVVVLTTTDPPAEIAVPFVNPHAAAEQRRRKRKRRHRIAAPVTSLPAPSVTGPICEWHLVGVKPRWPGDYLGTIDYDAPENFPAYAREPPPYMPEPATTG